MTRDYEVVNHITASLLLWLCWFKKPALMRILNWQLCQSCSIEAPSLCPTLAPVFLTSMRRFTSPLCSRLPRWLRPCLPRPLSSPRQSSPGALTPMPGANLPWAYRSEEGAEEANFSAMSSTFILSQQVLRDFSREAGPFRCIWLAAWRSCASS